jgi:DNA topoisomerase-6 subunit B
MYDCTDLSYSQRGPSEWNGNPFIVEGVITCCKENHTSEPTLHRFANRVPLLYDANEDVLSKMMKRIDWSRYGVDNNHSTMLFIHICSTKIPYKAAGKQSLDSIPEIEKESLALFRALGRKFGKFVKRRARAVRNTRRMRGFAKNFRQIAKYGSILADIESVPSTKQMVETLFEVNPNA